MTRELEGRRYLRAVEAAWSKLSGRPVVVSPREFEAVEAWRRRGIPLRLVLEALSTAAKRGRVPKSLTGLKPAIDEAFALVAAGRSAASVAAPVPERGDARRAWQARMEACADDAPLRAVLARLLAEDGRGAPPSALDAALDAALRDAVSPDELERARAETRSGLAPFRARMSEEEFQSTSERAVVERLRERLALPRLALTR